MFSCVRQPTEGVKRDCTKRNMYKCTVELTLNGMEGVTLSNGVLFAKVRLLSGGQFCRYSSRREIRDNRVTWCGGGGIDGGSIGECGEPPLQFSCRLPAGALRVSVRKEEKGGRSFSKLGFVNIDLAAVGCRDKPEERAFILTPYSPNQRLDNSTLRLSLYLRCLPVSAEEPLEASDPDTPSPHLHKQPPPLFQQQPQHQPPQQPLPLSLPPPTDFGHWRRQSDCSSVSLGPAADSRAGSLGRDSTLGPAFSACQSSSGGPPGPTEAPSLVVERMRTCRELPERIVNTRANNHSIVEQVLQAHGIDVTARKQSD